MEDDLGPGLAATAARTAAASVDVAAVAAREARHLGAERAQPQRQPAALEAGVAGHEDTPPGPERAGDRAHRSQTFQGASPAAHRRFSSVNSR